VRRTHAVAVLALIAFASFVGRSTAAVDMGGTPLHVFASANGDATGPGGLQARFAGETTGQFVDPAANATPAGLHVAVNQATVYGPPVAGALASTPFTETSAPVLSGAGTANDPLKLVSSFTAGSLLIDQTLTYVTGESLFHVSYTFTNNGGNVTFRPSLAANLFITGGNQGYGVFNPGPPRLVSGLNDFVGDGGAFQDSAPPSFAHYQEDDISSIWAAIANPAGQGFADTVNGALVNPGIGIQWPDTPLTPAGTASYGATVFVGGFDGLTLSPQTAAAVPGTATTLTAAVTNHGHPAAGKTVLYAVSGQDSFTGSATSDASGNANITFTGSGVGTDTVVAYVDSNNNGVKDPIEVLRTSTIVWRLAKPVFGKTANLTPVSGTVSVTVGRRHRKIKLKGPRQIPVGSIVNVSHGKANLQTARNRRGGKQHGKFYGGSFKVVQKKAKRRKHDATLLSLRGGTTVQCPARAGRATIAVRRKKRHLWGDGHGSFKTIGQNSAAAVRGTRWLVSDTCAGTLTRVKRGVVLVTDFVHHRTVILRKGHSYLARFG
jgi:hypothetical protein